LAQLAGFAVPGGGPRRIDVHFMLETIIAAHFLGVDPFDQPAVEENKVLAKKYLMS
jgi:glucose-6-phosphate isomerase